MIGWTALRALLGGWLGRIGGWIVAGLSVLAWLKWRDHKAKADVMREQETQGAQARRKADDEVARIPDADRVRELQRWER